MSKDYGKQLFTEKGVYIPPLPLHHGLKLSVSNPGRVYELFGNPVCRGLGGAWQSAFLTSSQDMLHFHRPPSDWLDSSRFLSSVLCQLSAVFGLFILFEKKFFYLITNWPFDIFLFSPDCNTTKKERKPSESKGTAWRWIQAISS